MQTNTYQIRVAQEYIIHDRPIDKLPIRRLQQNGGDTLATNELLQIALGRVDGFEQLIHEYGTHFLTTLHTVPEIVETLHLDHLQATRLLAILAIGKRLYAPEQGSLITIKGIEDIYEHYRSLANLAKEQLRVLLINSRYQLVHEEIVAIGTTDALTISPKEVFQSAVERRVTAVILLHNHPSGEPTPSTSDLTFTRTMKEAATLLGIDLLDHVIVARNGYASCLESL